MNKPIPVILKRIEVFVYYSQENRGICVYAEIEQDGNGMGMRRITYTPLYAHRILIFIILK